MMGSFLRTAHATALWLACATGLVVSTMGVACAKTGYVVGSPDDVVLHQIRVARAVPERLDATSRIGPVRHTALRETAQTLGVQAGLGVESRRIMAILEARADQLDRRFRFNELMMDVGVLPPVISQADDAVALDGPTMRVAQRLYRLDEPARFVTAAPTWRDWLLVGLAPGLHPQVPQIQQLLPRDEQEQIFWQAAVDEAYATGVAQAQSIFDLNMARLERSYVGMRLFLDLYARGMVTKPQIVAAESIIERDDPRTIVVGSTVFRITRHSDFVEEFDRWKPLGR